MRVRHFPYSLWKERYLPVFPQIEVIGHDGVAPSPELDSLPISSGPGLTFTSLPDLSSLTNQLIKRPQIRRTLAKKISSADITIVRLPSEIGYVAVQEARRLRKPYVIEAVGCPYDALWNHGTIRGKLWAPIARHRMKTATRHARHVIYVTEKFLQRRYPTAGAAIACSNVTLDGTADSPPETVKLPLANREKVTFGLIGYLGTDYKGADTAILALAEIGKTNVHLEIVGGGDSTRLKLLAKRLGIQDRVKFHGQLPHDAVKAWLPTLDLYLQPSRQEGLPRSLLEAMSLGLPAIGSTAGGIPELLPESDLHKPSDHKHLSALLHRALFDDQWREKSARRNLETARRYLFSTLNARRHSFLWSAAKDGAIS